MILTLTPNLPGASTFTLVNDGASDTGYELLQGSAFGSPVWGHTFSGERGTQGARPAQGKLSNREVSLVIRAAGASKDAMAVKVSTLADVVEDLRRYGGSCRWRSKGQTRYQSADVLTASIDIPEWNNRLEHRARAVLNVRMTCGPYMLGDPMDVLDDFTIDNVNGGEANYTADAGALANLAVTGGVLDAVSNLSTENRLIHTGTGYTYGDHEATILASPGSTITSFKAGVILKRIDASNYLTVYVDDNGTNSRLRIDKVVAASTTNLASTNLAARVVNGTRLWIRGRIEGNVVHAEHFLTTNVPTPSVAPTTSTSIALTVAEAAVLGTAVEGRAGITFTPQQTAAFLDDFEVLPFTYRNPPSGYVLDCFGAVPGDAPALASARMAMASGLTTTAWGLLSWMKRTGVENLIHYGDFEPGFDPLAGSLGALWTIAGVTGVTGAASSIAAVNDGTLGAGARFGETVGQIVCPATANRGAAYPMYRRFRAGQTYTASIWVRASSGTTNARLRLGVSGDIASSTAVALSTTWTQHTVAWTPATAVDVAYLAVEITAATATTFQIDGAVVYAGTTAPTVSRQAEGAGASPPLASFRAEEVGTEPLRAGVTRTSDATANGGFSIADSSILAGGETILGLFLIEPGLAAPDDYTEGSVAVEVWARIKISAAFTGGVLATLSALPETWDTAVLMRPPEFGQTGRTVILPSSGNDKWRLTRLGSLDLPTDGGSTRWSISINIGVNAGTNLQVLAIDDIFVTLRNARFCSPTETFYGTGYPTFLPSGKSHRTVRPDLSSSIATATSEASAGGIGGSLFELPNGLVSVLAIGSSDVPGNTGATDDSELQGFPSLHLSVRPRYHWLRDS